MGNFTVPLNSRKVIDAIAYSEQLIGESICHLQKFRETAQPSIVMAASVISDTILRSRKILICGNGGSAADAQHLASEMVGRLSRNRPAYPAMALSADTSNLTAIGNDYGYEHVFSRQVAALGSRMDLLVAISTSGNSPNVLKAVQEAVDRKMRVIVMTGGTGGKLVGVAKRFSDQVPVVISVETAKSASRIQECHKVAMHLMVELVENIFLKDDSLIGIV